MSVRDEAYNESVSLLKKLVTDRGFVASSEEVSNYRRIWARDGTIEGLAALASGDDELIAAFRSTLETLKDHQDDTGRIPSNVSLDEHHVSYGTSVGRIDATLWYVIGVTRFAIDRKDEGFFYLFKESVDKAIFYLRCLELNGRGFLYIPHGGDWADEYINHGYVLFDQVLYYLALSSYCTLAEDAFVTKRKDDLRAMIRINYFPSRSELENPYVYHQPILEDALRIYERPFPITFFTNYSVYGNVDTFAAALLLGTDILPPEFKEELADALCALWNENDFAILPAFYPVINPGDPKWDELSRNHLFGFRNKPYEYHNGGLWPLVHGFFVAALPEHEDEKKKLDNFADLLARDKYVFPEYYNGKTEEPGGTKYLGWSAAAYILAYAAVIEGRRIFTND